MGHGKTVAEGKIGVWENNWELLKIRKLAMEELGIFPRDLSQVTVTSYRSKNQVYPDKHSNKNNKNPIFFKT